jgi:DNA-binding XRE family transcriptional regulator
MQEVRQVKIKAKRSLRDIRIKKGLSITGLAKVMKVNPSVVYKMENGNAVRPATAKKVCVALNEEFETIFIIEN